MNDSRRRFTLPFVATIVAAIGALAVTALLVNIFTRQQEARDPFYRVVELTDDTQDPAQWGQNFPLQYDGYKRTVDQVRTRYGGSEAVPREPSAADPRSVVAQSRLEEDPRLKRMWAGYAFAQDFREERGHAYMLDDQTFTERQQVAKQPGTCMHCHASVYVPYKTLGGGDLIAGFEKMNQMAYADARKLVTHPVTCLDCHDPQTMQLRVTRPGFIEGIKLVRSSSRPGGYDVNLDATRQEMRSFVCGQCHVEYYCGPKTTLFYPWNNGMKVEQIESYYDQFKFPDGHTFYDWTHAETGANVLKAQHPEFETWSQGIHARSGVACADCHMPYKREGAMKVSDHWVRSPLTNPARACQVCHPYAETEIVARVEAIQERTHLLLERAAAAVTGLYDAVNAAKKTGATDAQLADVHALQRKAQWRLDFVAAENSMGFHAPQETARVLAEAIDFARQGQMAAKSLTIVPVAAHK